MYVEYEKSYGDVFGKSLKKRSFGWRAWMMRNHLNKEESRAGHNIYLLIFLQT